MTVARLETFHCDASWRTYSFLKVTTKDGLVGWSEYNEKWGFGGVTPVIHTFGSYVIGRSPLDVEAISTQLTMLSRPNRGGVLHGAVAAIENALLDLKGKMLGIPVYRLFGGGFRTRLPTYWSHCGSYRTRFAEALNTPPVRTLDDLVALGAEAKDRGFAALKTNYMPHDGTKFGTFQPGTAQTPGHPALNYSPAMLRAMTEQLLAFRQGAGPDVGIMLDVNFSFRTEGFIQVARAVEPAGLAWLECDLLEPDALAAVRRVSTAPIASCEHMSGRKDYRPFFDAHALDVALVDVLWNGYLESMKIASLAETYEINVAAHNLYSPLGDLMAAHYLAAIPNFRIMEYDVDILPWTEDLLTHRNVLDGGQFVLSDRPGWGADIDEAVIREHPPRAKDGSMLHEFMQQRK